MLLIRLVPDIREHNLLVSEAVNNINISFNDAAAQFEATVASLEFGEEIVKSALNLLDQVSAGQCRYSLTYGCMLMSLLF